VVCGLWFVVCGLWFVVCGLWFVVCVHAIQKVCCLQHTRFVICKGTKGLWVGFAIYEEVPGLVGLEVNPKSWLHL